jgi:hypothetical protein
MVAAENFVAELDGKNQGSIQRIIDALSAALAKDGVEVADALRYAVKASIESAEVAALWITDCDDLEMKLSLAEQCGDSARQCRKLSERLVALGVIGYDPRAGGYSKSFAFLRSLQTTEERSSAGYVTGRALSMARLGALAGFCERKGDGDSARLLGVDIMGQERRYYEQGKQMLVAAVPTEESQARARRAAYRTLELAGETAEPLQLRKALGKRR